MANLGTIDNPFPKDPAAVKDYTVRWDAWLANDTIATSTWIVPSGITKTSDSNTTTQATVWLSGGTEGQKYMVTNRITTAGARTDDRSLYVSITEQ